MKSFLKMFQFLSKENGRRSAAVFLSLTLVISNVLGFVRDAILAKNAFPVLDAYYAAFRWPDFVFNIVVVGAIAMILQPLFAERQTKEGEAAAFRFVSALTTWTMLILGGLMALLFLLMPFLVHILVPAADTETKTLTLQFGRVFVLSPLIFALSNIVGTILNLKRRFFAYALAPLCYNLALIVGALLYPQYGPAALEWSVVGGALLHLSVQLPALSGLGRPLKLNLSLRDAQLGKLLGLGWPRMLGLGLSQILLVVFTGLGSYIGPKSIAIFNLTNNFQTAPTVIVALALSTILFPSLSLSYAAKNLDQFKSYVVRGIELLFFLLVPSTVAMYVLRAQLTRLYLALGKNLGWADTIRAINTLGAFTYGVIFSGLTLFLAKVLYAQHETRRPMLYSAIGAIVSITAAVVFIFGFHLDVAALAFAYAIGQFINALLLWLDIRRTILTRQAERDILFHSLPKVFIGSLGMAIAIWLALRLADFFLPTERVYGLAAQTLIAGLIGAGVYLILVAIQKSRELGWLFEDRASVATPVPPTQELSNV